MFFKNKKPKKESKITPRAKGLIFFGVYFLFFLFVFTLLSGKAPTSNKKLEDNTLKYQITNIKSDNYHFKYSLSIDDEVTTLEGDRLKEKSSFIKTIKDTSKKYYDNNGTILIKESSWEVALEDPYPYKEFLDIKEINRLIKNSTYISTIEYANSESVIDYSISTTTLYSLLKNINIDIEDEPNHIKLYLKDKEVYKVELDISPYITYQDNIKKEVVYTLDYSNFGSIKEIKQD